MSDKIRTLQGRVVSDKMEKSFTVCNRTLREAPNLWEIH